MLHHLVLNNIFLTFSLHGFKKLNVHKTGSVFVKKQDGF
ncbi:hypothetical protein JCM19302_1950 [Jejuia pallidilutea]|uniref:Uncharacterized protein n=1 Tax=Jejuia pallidilutea TaxID=504487 RepID=A0A090W460_9FLAO|nr:hypothetical protein JCM19302_1950 [Jejuia pallidilutea]